MIFFPTWPAEKHNYGWWTQDILTNLVCRYHSQGGTEYTCIKNQQMKEDLDYLLEQMGAEVESIHPTAFQLLSRKRNQ